MWSAGCSTGEEPYTLAMVLSEYALAHSGFSFRILATDVCATVLEKAELGIYSGDAVRPVPPAMKAKYLMRSRDRGAERARVVPELRRLVEFRRLNFMDPDYGILRKAGVIFCRNVIIYFDRPTQQRILTAHQLPGAGRLSVRRPCRNSARIGSAAHSIGAHALPEDRCRRLRSPFGRCTCSRANSCLVTQPAILRTMLGSCVGVTFLVPRLGVGALCHPMLPRCPAKLLGNRAGDPLRGFRNPRPGAAA